MKSRKVLSANVCPYNLRYTALSPNQKPSKPHSLGMLTETSSCGHNGLFILAPFFSPKNRGKDESSKFLIKVCVVFLATGPHPEVI